MKTFAIIRGLQYALRAARHKIRTDIADFHTAVSTRRHAHTPVTQVFSYLNTIHHHFILNFIRFSSFK